MGTCQLPRRRRAMVVAASPVWRALATREIPLRTDKVTIAACSLAPKQLAAIWAGSLAVV